MTAATTTPPTAAHPGPYRYAPCGDSDGETVGTDHFVLDATGSEIACPGDEATARLLAMAWTLRSVLADILEEWHPVTPYQVALAMAARNIVAESRGEPWTSR